MYPTIIPTRNGIIFKKPFPLTITIDVAKNVIKATTTLFHSKVEFSARPICPTALPASPRPIIIIIGPITIGGNILSIHFLPIIFTIRANTT